MLQWRHLLQTVVVRRIVMVGEPKLIGRVVGALYFPLLKCTWPAVLGVFLLAVWRESCLSSLRKLLALGGVADPPCAPSPNSLNLRRLFRLDLRSLSSGVRAMSWGGACR